MRHRDEVAVSVVLFLVCMLKSDHEKPPFSVLIGTVAVRSAQKLGNKHGECVYIE